MKLLIVLLALLTLSGCTINLSVPIPESPQVNVNVEAAPINVDASDTRSAPVSEPANRCFIPPIEHLSYVKPVDEQYYINNNDPKGYVRALKQKEQELFYIMREIERYYNTCKGISNG